MNPTIIELIKSKLAEISLDYPDDSDNHNTLVYLAVEELKEENEVSEEFDVSPEEVEEIFTPFINNLDFDITIYDL